MYRLPSDNFLAESSQHTYSRTRARSLQPIWISRIYIRYELVSESSGVESRMAGESKPSSNDQPRKADNPTNKLNSQPNHHQSNQALSKLATTYKTGANQSRPANASKFVTSLPAAGEEGSSRVSMHDPPPPAAQSRHPSHKSASRLWKKAKVRTSHHQFCWLLWGLVSIALGYV